MSKRRRRNHIPQGEFEASIVDLTHDGKGVAKIEEKTVFVAGALPDETVMMRYLKRKRSFDEAVTVDIVKSSPDRVVPKCEYFMRCGGCALQHLEGKKQITFKQQSLLEQFKRLGNVEPQAVIEPLTDAAWGYRRKARLGVRVVDKKGGALVGFREVGSNYLTVMDSCEVLHPQIGHKIDVLRNLIDEMEIGAKIAQIEVAMGDQDCVLVFRNLVDVPESDMQKLDDFGKAHGFFIYLQSGGPETVQPLNDSHQVQLGYTIQNQGHADIDFVFNPSHFTQVNFGMNQKMIALALELLDLQAEDRVLDLFCGLGNFTLPMAQKSHHVLGLEGSQSLVQDAKENAACNHIENVNFAVLDLQDEAIQAAWMNESWDKILLDPPRSGAKEIMPVLAKLAPEIIVYVSCNPATLARDSDILVNNHSYICTQAGVMDMFPHTAHVESIAVFRKK